MLKILLLGTLLASCSAERGQVAEGQVPAEPRADARAEDPCRGSFDYEHCAEFLPAERMQGVWVTGFEQSGFIPGPAALPDPADPRRSRIWLDFAAGSPPDPALRRELDAMRTTAAVAMEFIGRRGRHPGRYGHLGGAREVVIVDRIVSMRILGPLRARQSPAKP